jgi:integrase
MGKKRNGGADYLLERNGWFSFHLRVPSDLVAHYGPFVRKALKTQDYQKARVMALDLKEKCDVCFARTRLNPEMTQQEITEQMQRVYQRAMRQKYTTMVEIDDARMALDEWHYSLYHKPYLVSEDGSVGKMDVLSPVEQILKDGGMILTDEMREQLQRMEITTELRALEKHEHQINHPYLSMKSHVLTGTMEPPELDDSINLIEAVNLFINRGHTLSSAPARRERNSLSLFIEFMGEDRTVASITRKECVSFLDAVSKFYPSYPSKLQSQTINLEKIRALGEHDTISKQTVLNFKAVVERLYSWLDSREIYKGDSPMPTDNKWIPGKVTENDKDKGFTDKQVADILNSFEFELDNHTISGAMPWVSLLGAFTGANCREITDRKIEDFGQENDIWYMSIYESKNPNRTRQVPLHPQIIEAGFTEYLDSCKKEGEWAFPGLKFDKHGESRSGTIQSYLGTHIKQFAPGRATHAFRHTVSNRLRMARVPENDRAQIVGHSEKGMTDKVYGGTLSLQHKFEDIKKLHFPGINLRLANSQERRVS